MTFFSSFLEIFNKVLDAIYPWACGLPLIVLITCVGVYLTFALRGIQFKYLGFALKIALGSQDKNAKGDISHFQALMTALAATIGTGNIAGVATAITVGGLGALFWMWLTALIGMSIKYAEALLAVKYRITDKKGEMSGGPMYFIEKGLGWKWLAASFAIFGVFASFGGGNMLQANSVADAVKSLFQIDPLYTGIVVAIFTGLTLIGGIKSIGNVASILVPFMGFFYIGGASIVILHRADLIPITFMNIFQQAFTGQAAVGGFLGASVLAAIQTGVSRGIMTSEAGLGTASIAAAAARTDEPGRQALVSMTGSFLATIIMCTVTGLVLGVTQVQGMTDAAGNMLTGASLTLAAFNSVVPWGGYIVTVGLVLFAFTTLIGWAYYGEKCVEYLFGEKVIPFYRLLFTIIVVPGAVLNLEIVWKFTDITNSLMAIPNLIGILALGSVVISETRSFLKGLEQKRALAIEQ
jgi:AGCS family alanine or glycine:cation symporter